jgi:hypothetical protein
MSTNGIIARSTGEGTFKGVYHHWDSYPNEGLGQYLTQILVGYFKNDLAGMLRILIDEHPAGWSTIVNKDFTLKPGYTAESLKHPSTSGMDYRVMTTLIFLKDFWLGESELSPCGSHVKLRSMEIPFDYEPGDYLKFEMKDDTTGESEWMWLKLDSCDSTSRTAFGRLDSQPLIFGDKLELGQQIAVSYDNIREYKKKGDF